MIFRMRLSTAMLGALLLLFVAAVPVRAEDQTVKAGLKFTSVDESLSHYEQQIKPVFLKKCAQCHNEKTAEGELNLGVLAPDMKSSSSAARWVVVAEKVAAREMPPKAGTPLQDSEILAITDWIAAEMKRSGKHLAKRETYDNGNKVSHHLLFDPTHNTEFDAPPRIRTVSPDIYARQVKDLSKGFENLVGQPFSPSGKTTFSDMALAKIDEPVTAQLIRNAQVIVERLTSFTMVDGKLKPAIGANKDFIAMVDEAQPFGDQEIAKAVKLQFQRVLQRQPTSEELERFSAFMKKNIAEAGRAVGVRYTLAAVFLLPEGIFRYELGNGTLDDEGRVRLTPQEIATAISMTLTDQRVSEILNTAAAKGEFNTDAGVAAATQRLLNDSKAQKPRILRFFQEYFGYTKAKDVFKEMKEFPGHDPSALVEDTNHLIEMILAEDRDVLRELLTTNKSFVSYKTAADTKKKRAEALAKFEADKAKDPVKFKDKKPNLPGRAVYESYNLDDFPDAQPIELPKHQRAGILTQPSWLIAWSTADDNHVILRGKWVRERLLGGVVPDIPITVDAQLPDAPHQTLRERMTVTNEKYCWQCHQYMNRVGYPFEMFDHFGRFRSGERVLDLVATEQNVDPKNGKSRGKIYKDVPVNAGGGFEFTLDPKLTGEVENAIEFMHKLAQSEVVEQVFVRHVFRYLMGRNETLGDAETLRRAHAAYRENRGSMNALIVSLLSSESFLYRVPVKESLSAEKPVTSASE